MDAKRTVTDATTSSFARLDVTPSSSVVAVGGTVQLVAVPMDASGSRIDGMPAASYRSGQPATATVDAAGLVTGMAVGEAVITATLTANGVTRTASAVVTVTAGGAAPRTVRTPGVTFDPASLTIAAGDTVTWQFSGAVHNVTFVGAAPPGGNIADQAVGSVVTRAFPSAGTFAYECTRHAGMTGEVIVQSGAAVFTSVVVSPAAVSIVVGDTVRLTAWPRDQHGSVMTGLPPVVFVSSDATIVNVTGGGLVTAVGEGTATIRASVTQGGVTHAATAGVTVAPRRAGAVTVTTPNLRFSPQSVTIPIGGTVTWQFSESVHNVTFAGLMPPGGNIGDQAVGSAVTRTFPSAGTFSYECTRHAGMTGEVVVQSGTPVFTAVAIVPESPSIVVGDTVRLLATARDQHGSVMTGLPAATFVSTDGAIVRVDAAGLVTGLAEGTATIRASVTHEGVTHTATATVTVSRPVSGAITVTTPSLQFSPQSVTIPIGGTVTWQFSESTHNVTFTGPSPAGGSIPDQNAGSTVSRTFATAGTFSYACTRHSGMVGEVVVQGGGGGPAQFSGVKLSPGQWAMRQGSTKALIATPVDQYGLPMTGLPPAVFRSSDPGIVSVGGAGGMQAIAQGTATITATVTSGGVTHTATAAVNVVSASAVIVTIGAGGYTPDRVTIAAGGTVIWEVTGSSHNMTFDVPPNGGHIPETEPGNAIARTFPTAGDYDYECTLHGEKGRVRVR